MSTKYQRPSGSYAGSTELTNRSKYQNDAGAEPRVPISSTKIDGDFNYVIDALNAIDEASGSRASIDDRMSVALNADGTLKGSVVASIDEWVLFQAINLNRSNNTTVTCDGDQTGIFSEGRRVRISIASRTVYGDVASASYDSSITTIVFDGLTDANGSPEALETTPSALYYSYIRGSFNGNMPNASHHLRLKNEVPLLRLLDTGTSGKEYALRSCAGALEIVENTGTMASPVWEIRATVNEDGIQLDTSCLPLSTLSDGTADRLMGYNGSGTPTEVTAGAGLALSSGSLSVVSGTSAGDLVALDGSAKLPAVDGSQLTNLPPAGLVKQVVEGTYSSTRTFASTTFSDVVSASITVASGSKVLVNVSYPMRIGGGSSLVVGSARLLRGGTTLFTTDRACGMSVDQEGCMISYCYLDTPPSAGTYTYTAQAARYSGSFNLFAETPQKIILEEISA
ncbi:MAG: hypothetical protein GC134_01895 [Proteobacteria bacterium]|nr:hypothetical protein [Pseudomonadota bacterium]